MFPASLATTPADVMMAVFDAKDLPHAMRVAANAPRGRVACAGLSRCGTIGKTIKLR